MTLATAFETSTARSTFGTIGVSTLSERSLAPASGVAVAAVAVLVTEAVPYWMW